MYEQILLDLAEEGDALALVVEGLAEPDWSQPTPAPGWSVLDQIAHLAWTDELAVRALTGDPAMASLVEAASASPETFADGFAHEAAAAGGTRVLARWAASRTAVLAALRGCEADAAVHWFGHVMSPASLATARLMETWAHGRDIADARRITLPPTQRLRQIVHLGLRTRDFAFARSGLMPPSEQFRVELVAPDKNLWTYGPPEAMNRITGSALDFCLLVTRRRHPEDLDLQVSGEQALLWLPIAQAFAGHAGQGRQPRTAPAPRL